MLFKKGIKYFPLPRTGGVNYVTPTNIVATNHGFCRLPIMGKSEVGLVEHFALVCLANWKVTIHRIGTSG
jgi:hypothetical protein